MSLNSEQFNSDELEAPAWMNTDFFSKVLQSSEKDDTIRVTNVKLTPGSMKGDHYASVMFRANVDYETSNRDKTERRKYNSSMIMKTMPERNGIKREIFHEIPLFETEIEMYSKVLPRFETVLREVGEKAILGARCLYHSLSPRKVIIFEDIVPLGYEVLRGRPMNLEETKLAYSKLAKFHAVSYKLLQEDPTFFSKFSYNVMDIAQNEMSAYFSEGIDLFVESLESRPELIKYKTYFETIQSVLIDRCSDLLHKYHSKPHHDTFYVLCHGDFHTRNMMFKRTDEGRLEDVMLLDYQLSNVGPMVADIIYSIYTILDEELRDRHFDELIYYYLCNFTMTLQRLDFVGRVPRMLCFRRMLHQHKDFELFLLMVVVPMWYEFLDGNGDFDKALTSTGYHKKMYLNKDFLDEVEKILQKYLFLGYLDD